MGVVVVMRMGSRIWGFGLSFGWFWWFVLCWSRLWLVILYDAFRWVMCVGVLYSYGVMKRAFVVSFVGKTDDQCHW